MKRSVFLCLLTLIVCFSANSQTYRSERTRPAWIRNQPVPSNETFVYSLHHDYASAVDEARTKCLNDLIFSSGFENGMVVVTDVNTTISSSMIWQGDRLVENDEDSFVANTSMKGKEHPLSVRRVAEYWERDRYTGQYHMYVLYERSVGEMEPKFDNVRITDRYGAGAFCRSIIPGWGQIYKGSTVKGILMFGGVALTAGTALMTEGMRKSYTDKMNICLGNNSTADDSKAQSFYTLSQNMELYRNLSIGACAAIYIYNLIDAAVAPGAARIVPVISPGGGVGVGYSKRF